ncbi:MAG: response regulator transcription factor [Treponema sp.]|jgi:DNA-binding NarL/FixJ family response regulator|nr:response regulator transcription factor [Treponema sp.]
MIKVILIQNQQKKLNLILSLLKSQDDFYVAGAGKDNYSALHLTETQCPDVAVVDHHLDRLSGLELIPLIKRRCSTTMVVLFSACDDERYALEAINEGVSGYLLWKDKINLINAVRIAHNGGCYISNGIITRAFGMLLKISRYQDIRRIVSAFPEYGSSKMSRRRTLFSHAERYIIRLISEGRTVKEIVGISGLSAGTIRNYISSIMKKAGTRNRVQTAIFALKNGFLDP